MAVHVDFIENDTLFTYLTFLFNLDNACQGSVNVAHAFVGASPRDMFIVRETENLS